MASFERIIASNPEAALAYVGHATASIVMSMFLFESAHTAMPRARASIGHPLEIDPACPEAHAALGAVRALYDFDFGGANAALLMALRLKPGAIPILQARAAFYLAPLGLLEEAAAHVARAVEQEPRFLAYRQNLGWIQFLARGYAATVASMDRILEANKRLVPAIFLRALACERLGRYAAANEAFHSEDLRTPHPLVPLRAEALRRLRAGDTAEAARTAHKMEALYQPGFLNALAIAEVFAAVTDHDRAFHWLDTAYQDRRHRLIYLKSEPVWDPIRNDRRFTQLITRMSLAQDASHALSQVTNNLR